MTRSMETSASDLAEAVRHLRPAREGRVLFPGDAAFDQARAVYFAGIDRRPGAIVRVADAGEVAQVLAVARETGAELAVRGGGHSLAGHGVSDGGLVLDLSPMRSLELDPAARTAWAGGGLTTGEYTAAAAEHGLATGFGDTPSVGIGGITLGGGVGFLHRKLGLTIDSLLAAEVVTADGWRIHTDPDREPELFWAIRGGGGNFGVVTRFQFRLHEVGTVVGGMLMLPADPELVVRFLAGFQAAPDELSGIVNVMRAPPAPFIPPEHHGRLVLFAVLVWAGEEDGANRALAPLRGLARPITDSIVPLPYPDLFAEHEGPPPPAFAATRSLFIDALDREGAEAVFEHVGSSAAAMSVAQFRVLGGAVARVPGDATAFAHRTRGIMTTIGAMYEEAGQAPEHLAWASSLADALVGDGEPGAYVGFMGDEGEAGVRRAYPGQTWKRLSGIKALYDTDNLFRLNQNIPPRIG